MMRLLMFTLGAAGITVAGLQLAPDLSNIVAGAVAILATIAWSLLGQRVTASEKREHQR